MALGDSPRVFVVCASLGHVPRGFESFARECFNALSGRDDLDMVLVKGRGGVRRRDRTVLSPHPDSRAARALGRLIRRPGPAAQQGMFAAGLAPMLALSRPDVVFLSEWSLARVLARWRTLSRQRFQLLLSNGAAGHPPFPEGVDHVQHLTPGSLAVALRCGEPPERHTMLPLGIAVGDDARPPSPTERAQARQRLGLPVDRPIVLSVAALNNWSKRLDYLIEEVASQPTPRPYVALVGPPEPETPAVLALAERLLGRDGFCARTVPRPEVDDFYRAADILVLASTTEAMGRVLPEAMTYGLACVTHDYPTAQFVLGSHGHLIDLRGPGNLARLLTRLAPEPQSLAVMQARRRHVCDNFSWEVLAPRYVDLFRRCAVSADRDRKP